MAEYADPFPNKDWTIKPSTDWTDGVMSDHRKYVSVSLEQPAIEDLHKAKAWLSGDKGRTVTLSEAIVQLVQWYREAREAEASAAINPWTDRAYRAVHTKDKPHTLEDCDVCNYNQQLDNREQQA